MRSGMACVTVLPATHTFIHECNEPSCLYSVSIHQMAPPKQGIVHPITAHYSFYRLRKDERLPSQPGGDSSCGDSGFIVQRDYVN